MIPLQVDVEPRRNYLYVLISGRFSVPGTKAAYTQVLQAAARHRATRILLDCTPMSGEWTLDNRREFGEFMADEHRRMAGQLAGEPQVAILVSTAIMDPNRYTQVVANNRGVRMRASDNLSELMSWLGV